MTDQAQVDAAVKEVEEKWGRLDVLVNNAGFMAEDCFEPLGVARREDWEYTIEVSVIGAAKITRALLPVMLKGGDKTVVNISSIGALYPDGGAEAYGISKMILCRAAEFLSVGYAKEVSFTSPPLDISWLRGRLFLTLFFFSGWIGLPCVLCPSRRY